MSSGKGGGGEKHIFSVRNSNFHSLPVWPPNFLPYLIHGFPGHNLPDGTSCYFVSNFFYPINNLNNLITWKHFFFLVTLCTFYLTCKITSPFICVFNTHVSECLQFFCLLDLLLRNEKSVFIGLTPYQLRTSSNYFDISRVPYLHLHCNSFHTT